MYKNFIKIVLDTIFSIVGLIILSPLFICITILCFLFYAGHPFFFQERLGKNGKIFKIIKFKTMNNKKDQSGKLLPDAQRLNSFGQFIRKNSLDEIPQLINVIQGNMSLIGPRPLLPEYLHLYNDDQRRRNDVKPGITGWAQVNGRNAISWEKKFEYDVWYVNHMSLFLDIKIFLLTIKKVSIRDGISQEGHVTSEEFKGN